MEIVKEDIIDIDLDSGTVARSFTNYAIGEGDKEGNIYGVRLFKQKQQIDPTGCTVTGYFIRADKTTVIIGGIISNKRAYIKLPQSCYAVEGNFTLAIKITYGSSTMTARVVDGTVIDTTSDAVIDPGGIVPDISELLAVIERAEDAAEAIAEFSITEELISGDDYRVIINVE